MLAKIIVITLTFVLLCLNQNVSSAQDNKNNHDDCVINGSCIGKVCIGDTFSSVKSKYSNDVIKVNDSNTGYYIFDERGNFLIEFSTKRMLDDKKASIRYIMTSNSKFRFVPGNIHIETKISDLTSKYGEPKYQPGPNGYIVSFDNWPIKETAFYKTFKVNTVVSVYNPRMVDLYNYTGTINESAEEKLLKQHANETIINTIEIYSDYLRDGKPLK